MVRVKLLRMALVSLASLLLFTIGLLQTGQSATAASQEATSSTLPPRQDAYVHASRPDSNFGEAHLAVGPSAHAFVQFDLSTLPRAAQIERAVLRLKPFRLPDSEPVEVQLGKVEAVWAEGRITWNNKPAITPGGPTVAVADLDWVEWTVTELVQQWHGGRLPNHGFGVYTTNPGQGLLFHSRETGSAPELVISLQGNDDDQPGELRISQQVETAGELVRRGEVVTYTIHLRHEGGTAPLQAELRTVLSAVEYLAPGVYVEEVSFRATPLQVRVEQARDAEGRPHQIVSWRGTLEPDAELKFTLPVYVRGACAPGAATQTVSNETVARIPGGDPLRAMAEYTVACPQASLDDIDVMLELGGDEINWLFEPVAALADALHINRSATDMQVQVRATLTNRNQEQAIVGYQLETRYIGETERNLDAYSPSATVILGPGESRTFEVWTDMRPLSYRLNQLESTAFAAASSQTEDDDELTVEFILRYTLLPTARPGQPVDFTDATNVRTVTRPVRIRAWDLGDAPDSTNHAGVPMEAYPGVRANFPTVFDPAVSNPQGPAHARPRHFHLGRSVDPEVDADLGPAPNINPTAGSADHDLFDDGALPHAWNLTHCRPTTVDVRIFVSPAAANWFRETGRQGYLNGWIDANRDGDWADNVRCPADEVSSPPVALEHFIIDQPIDVAALGAGYHAVSVQTGRVPWPADRVRQPAWVRLTLSERPSAKVGNISGIDYGDGRGHARPFRTGETEDYLLRPAGSPGAGPDMQVTVTGGWQPSPLRPVSPVAAGFTYQKIEWSFRVDFANVGSEAATNVILNVDVPEALRGQDAELALVAPRRDAQTIYLLDPERDAEVVQVSDDRISVNLGAVAPGQRGRLQVTFRPEIGDEVVTSYLTKADIISLHDVNPGNNSASFKVEITGAAVTQGAFGFRSPGAPYLVRSGATNSPTLILEGLAPRGLLLPAVQLYVHRLLDAARTEAESSEVYEAPVDADGRWSLQLENLPDGFYQFAVGHPNACDVYGYNQAETLASSLRTLAGNDNEWRLHSGGTACGLAVVDTTLDVDPISMTFTEVTGLDVERNARLFLPDTLGWSQGSWRVRLFDTNPEDGTTRPTAASVSNAVNGPREYKVAINARSNIDAASLGELILSITGFGSFETKLVESAVPGRYETHFIIGDGGGMPGVVAANLPDRELAISLRLENEARQVQYDGKLMLESPGLVVDAVSGSGVAGASITLLSAAALGDELVFAPWDGGEQGQANPIQTAADGSYSLVAPDGAYQLYVSAPGYQPYRRAVLSTGGLITPTVALVPLPTGETSFVVAMTENGFEPPLRAVRPGATVTFINMDGKPRQLMGSGFDSGLLAPGEVFHLVAGAEGVVSYQDGDRPADGVLIIDPNAAEDPIGLPPREEEEEEEEHEEFGSQSLFLPLVSR